jgi:imidazolonepropionase-like amidohydrolase
MRLLRLAPGLCTLFLTAGFVLAQAPPSPVTVLTHATVIDGTGRAPARDTTIVMSAGRIAAMGPASKIKAPAGAEVIDLTGKTVIPGIFDLHTHLGIDTPAKIAMYAHYGVTSAIGMGGDGDEVLKLRDAQRQPGALTGGARIYTVQQRFEFEKGGAEQARMMVDALAVKHVDAVKVVIDDRRGKAVKLPRDFAAAAIDEAHKRHLKALAHIHDLEDARFVVTSGIDMLAHQVRDKEIDDAFIAEMKKRNVTVTSTLTRELSDYCWADSPDFLNDAFLAKFYPAPRLAQLHGEFKDRQAANPEILLNRRDFEMATKNLKKMHAASLRIGFGTDSGNGNPRLEGYFDHLEMEYMVKYGGMTPMEVITAYSKVNTETLGIDKDYGTLATGKVADLLVLDKNPLDDITNTKSLRTVYIGGRKFE